MQKIKIFVSKITIINLYFIFLLFKNVCGTSSTCGETSSTCGGTFFASLEKQTMNASCASGACETCATSLICGGTCATCGETYGGSYDETCETCVISSTYDETCATCGGTCEREKQTMNACANVCETYDGSYGENVCGIYEMNVSHNEIRSSCKLNDSETNAYGLHGSLEFYICLIFYQQHIIFLLPFLLNIYFFF